VKTLPFVLVVDDDEEIRTLLARYLATQNFRVAAASNRKSLMGAMDASPIDLIVLDVMLPDGSGIEICRELRVNGSRVPIILLTALKEDVDRIIGLEVGADDYMSKPFNPRELAARIRAVLRRHQGGSESNSTPRSYRFEGFSVEPGARRVLAVTGEEVDLTAAEFDLLHALVSRPGRVLSRDRLLDLTRGREADPFDRSVDVLMSRIRRKLHDDGGTGLIKTIRNGGYQFTARVETVGVES
jgi:two-component system OmpR family response regulator